MLVIGPEVQPLCENVNWIWCWGQSTRLALYSLTSRASITETLEILKMRKRALKSLQVLMIDINQAAQLHRLWSALLFFALLLNGERFFQCEQLVVGLIADEKQLHRNTWSHPVEVVCCRVGLYTVLNFILMVVLHSFNIQSLLQIYRVWIYRQDICQ